MFSKEFSSSNNSFLILFIVLVFELFWDPQYESRSLTEPSGAFSVRKFFDSLSYVTIGGKYGAFETFFAVFLRFKLKLSSEWQKLFSFSKLILFLELFEFNSSLWSFSFLSSYSLLLLFLFLTLLSSFKIIKLLLRTPDFLTFRLFPILQPQFLKYGRN